MPRTTRNNEYFKRYLDLHLQILEEIKETNKAINSRLETLDNHITKIEGNINQFNTFYKWLIGILIVAVIFLATGKLLSGILG